MAKIDNEKLTAAKKILRAGIEERRMKTFTPTDAVEDLKAEIIDMAAVGYSIEEIEEKLKVGLGLSRVPMTRVRKILKEAAASPGLESADSPAQLPEAAPEPVMEPTIEKAAEAPAEIQAEAEVKRASETAAMVVPGGQSSISNAVSAVKASLAAGLTEKLQPALYIKPAAAETIPLPQALVAEKKEVQNAAGHGVFESGGQSRGSPGNPGG